MLPTYSEGGRCDAFSIMINGLITLLVMVARPQSSSNPSNEQIMINDGNIKQMLLVIRSRSEILDGRCENTFSALKKMGGGGRVVNPTLLLALYELKEICAKVL